MTPPIFFGPSRIESPAPQALDQHSRPATLCHHQVGLPALHELVVDTRILTERRPGTQPFLRSADQRGYTVAGSDSRWS